MGEDEVPQSPAMEEVPPPKTTAELIDEAALAQEKSFDRLLPMLPRYAQTMTDIQVGQAPQLLQSYVSNQKVFGPQLLGMAMDMAKQADPTGFQLDKTLREKTLENLNAGGGLTNGERQLMVDDFRQAQANRGFGTGLSDAIDEASFLNAQRFGREQTRMANAMAVLSGRNPADKFMGGIAPNPTVDVSGMAGNLLPSTNSLMADSRGAYGMNANNINNRNQMLQHQFEFGVQNTRNPLQEDIMFGLGVAQGVGGIAGSIAGGAMGTSAMGGMAGGMGGMGGGFGGGGGFGYSQRPVTSWR